jgi:hypothetical protein
MIIKYSKADLKDLNFRYVVQLDNHTDIKNIFTTPKPDFWVEKRIHFIVAVGTCYGLYNYFSYPLKFESAEELLAVLNRSEQRYYRLLTEQEIIALHKWLEKRAAK